ncbi:glycosyltransferase [Alkalihalobacterium chitinilyticum]|uniref:Glycosyltransferase family 2 protein n=1 Tax=Alkalihalobacterium chitinilyticum TaxID=2980103 RepID=A0ABT5VGH7_9BACI|nr:glycosyltransferase family 2 protein [Alkalihalobacterium chitinilyticum]MDE5413548.1 glycosyltransferase family 2 protein [Alkalihalobacterium chitinilyticum]
MLILAIITCLFWFAVLIDATLGMRKLEKLENVETNDTIKLNPPLVSIIVAARNEEKDIEGSLQSQLQQTYKNIEWIVVNDRSTDQTGAIINQISNTDNRIQPIHIEHLDEGWLGKNHALYQGYLASKGDYLLFTDADVYYKPDTLEKALSFMIPHQVDHLTLAPNMNVKRFWAKAFVTFFLFGFSYFKRPWKANDDNSKIAIGIGAFNLLRRDAYEEIGTHQVIRERPDDDLMLGIQIKSSGKKQRFVSALEHLEVEWYATLKGALIGLEKNAFAGLYYRYTMVVFAILGVFISQLLPFLAVFFTTGLTRIVYLFTIALLFLLYHRTANVMAKNALKYFLVFPISVLLFIYCIIRATILTTVRGGIIWRGTHYPLAELRKPKKK